MFLLQNPQQLALQFQRDLTGLVQEQGPTRGGFEAAGPILERAGERALSVTEEFTLPANLALSALRFAGELATPSPLYFPRQLPAFGTLNLIRNLAAPGARHFPASCPPLAACALSPTRPPPVEAWISQCSPSLAHVDSPSG